MASLMTTMFPVAQRVQIAPAGARAQRVDVMLRVAGVRAGKHKILRLQAEDFLQADVRPFRPPCPPRIALPHGAARPR